MTDEIEIDTDDLERRMKGAMDSLRQEFASLRTGRASATMVEPIMVDAYGSLTPINQIGTVNVPEPRMVTINIWDKGLVGMGALDLPWGPSHEEIYVLGTGFVGKRGKSVIHIQGLSSNDPERFGHPTPKPVPPHGDPDRALSTRLYR